MFLFQPSPSGCQWSNLPPFGDGPCAFVGLGFFEMKVRLDIRCAFPFADAIGCTAGWMLGRFCFVHTEEEVTFKLVSTLQAWVTGQVVEGSYLPIRAELLEL